MVRSACLGPSATSSPGKGGELLKLDSFLGGVPLRGSWIISFLKRLSLGQGILLGSHWCKGILGCFVCFKSNRCVFEFLLFLLYLTIECCLLSCRSHVLSICFCCSFPLSFSVLILFCCGFLFLCLVRCLFAYACLVLAFTAFGVLFFRFCCLALLPFSSWLIALRFVISLLSLMCCLCFVACPVSSCFAFDLLLHFAFCVLPPFFGTSLFWMFLCAF